MPVTDVRILEANGIRQAVRLAGEPAAPAVLLIHGLGWDHTLWDGLVGPLMAAGWRVVAPDLRGMGGTDKPDRPYTIAGYADDLRALLDGLAVEAVAVVGFSLGGTVAAALATVEPRVRALVLACCGVRSSPAAEAATEAMLARAAAQGPLAFAREQAAAVWHPAWAAQHADAVRRFVEWRAAMDQPALHRAFRSAYGVDLEPALARLRIPVRVIAADDDPFAPLASVQGLAARLPGADLVTIAASGHMAPIERPEPFRAAVLAFLDRLPASGELRPRAT